jgi:hypothetical protein
VCHIPLLPGAGTPPLVQWLATGWKLHGSNPGRRKNSFVLQNVQTGFESHPVSNSMRTGVLFLWGKQPVRDVDHSSSPRAEVKNERRYTATAPRLPVCLQGRETLLLLSHHNTLHVLLIYFS